MTATAVVPPPAPPTAGDYRVVPIAELHESPWNPRKHFDPVKLHELASSLVEHGVLTPLLARPRKGGGYELAAGHRRLRAAGIGELTELPLVIREMNDVQFIEVLTIENLQRDDVHPLEEAQGYADLIKHASYNAQRIADRVGKSVKYVYDRIKLLELIPEAKKLFMADRFQAGHAILLARLTKEDQRRAIDPDDSGSGYQITGLWESENTLWNPSDDEPKRKAKADPYEELKAVSVRELEGWIDEHVRLDPTRDNEPLLFPEIAEQLADVEASDRKVIAITHLSQVHPDAKLDDERTYGPASWIRADGKKGSKPCDRSVIGYVAAGPGRGDAFSVCIDKMKCEVHYGTEIRARRKREKARETGSTAPATASKTAAAPKKQQWEIENEKRAARREAWKLASPAVIAAAVAATKKASLKTLTELVLVEAQGASAEAAKLIGRGTSAEDFVRWLAFGAIYEAADDSWQGDEGFRAYAKLLKIDVAKVIKTATPAPAKPAAKTAPAKKKAKR